MSVASASDTALTGLQIYQSGFNLRVVLVSDEVQRVFATGLTRTSARLPEALEMYSRVASSVEVGKCMIVQFGSEGRLLLGTAFCTSVKEDSKIETTYLL